MSQHMFSASLLLLICLTPLNTSQSLNNPGSGRIGLVFDTESPSHSAPLLKATFLALMDSVGTEPVLIDYALIQSQSTARTCAEWISGNRTASLVSLLNSSAILDLEGVLRAMDIRIRIFTPLPLANRSIPPFVSTLFSLQMNQVASATALLHRVTQVGCEALIPVLDDPGLLPSIHRFHLPSPVPILAPILLVGEEGGRALREVEGQDGNRTLGILLLSGKNGQILAERVMRESSRPSLLRWFSPELLPHPTGPPLFGLYSVLYVGAGQWDNPERRRLLRRLSQFTGASPLIVTAVLAYDSVLLANQEANGDFEPRDKLSGMSGEIKFDERGDRLDGVFLGVSALPPTSHLAPLLQPSAWVLEDVVHMMPKREGEKWAVVEHQVATSSVLTRDELLGMRLRREGCENETLRVSAHDPFTQMSYDYIFTPSTLPGHLIISNQYGFGLTFQCTKGVIGGASLSVACTPSGRALGEGVHCFRSNMRGQRSLNWNARDDSSNTFKPTNEYYPMGETYSVGVATTEDTTSEVPPLPSKLPELRQLLKAAKPFVGSCIGATTGCAICVLVLGRLPLGAVPAACTGPCFVGTFGSCGSLLGRVFAETTVICTELFQQGFLDVDTFLADAEFGRHMLHSDPRTLKGYQVLASPLVLVMQESEIVTRLVAGVALPWSRHMRYLVGHTEEWSLLGSTLHSLGSPLCALVGLLEMSLCVRGGLIGLLFLLLSRRNSGRGKL